MTGTISQLAAADIDRDGDSDLVLADETGLKYLRNDGGNQNLQLKIRLYGNRSTQADSAFRLRASPAGCASSARRKCYRWRSASAPTPCSTHDRALVDLSLNNVDVEVKRDETVTLTELILPTGSCPYLYCWDGERFRFVTDLLGASPLGLPVAEGVYIDADPDEIVWIGDETNFKPIDGSYRLQITEELREILYLDEAKLISVDVPTGTEVHPNTRLLPRGPTRRPG